MNRFAELLDRLAYEPGRNNKLRLITKYFREVEDPDRGYALAALTGALSFKHAKPGLIRDLIAARTDPVLFALSYDYVGDLSETVALMWPRSSPLPPRSGGEGAGGGGGGGRFSPRALRLAARLRRHPPPPTSRASFARLGPRHARCARREGSAFCLATTTRLLRRSPKSSPGCARWARPNCQGSSRAGSTSSTKPAAGHC